MDPNLTYPIVLNAPINATLLQQPQPWWTSTTLSTFITAIVTILAVYLGQKWAKSSEREREFLKARKHAFYEYINTFSDVGKREWTPALISEKLPTLWIAATEVEEYYGDLPFSLNYYIDDFLDVKEDPNICNYLDGYLDISRSTECKIDSEDGGKNRINVKSFIGFIELLEALLIIDPKFIKMDGLISAGQKYFPKFRRKLKTLQRRAPYWQFWK